MNEKELMDLIGSLKNVQNKEDAVEDLKEEISNRGLTNTVEKLGRKYALDLKKYAKDFGDFDTKSKDEKAQILLDIKNKMNPEEQQQFEKIMDILKIYIKKIK